MKRTVDAPRLIAVVLALGLMAALAVPVRADVEDGAQDCAGFTHGFKIEPPVDNVTAHAGVTITVDVADDLKSLTFSTDPPTEVTVFVKGGPDTTSFTGVAGTVESPLNPGGQQADISNFSVCFNEPVTDDTADVTDDVVDDAVDDVTDDAVDDVTDDAVDDVTDDAVDDVTDGDDGKAPTGLPATGQGGPTGDAAGTNTLLIGAVIVLVLMGGWQYRQATRSK